MLDSNRPEASPRLVQSVLYGALAIAAAVSMGRGLWNALANSQDMQWGALVLFWRDHLDPYQVLIQNPYTTKVVVAAYLHFHFFLFAPLVLVDFETAKILWALANVGFLTATLWIFRRHKDFGMPLALALLFLCATPTRNTFGNGQVSLCALFFFALYMHYADRRPLLAAVFASLGSAKYSLGVPLFFQMPFTLRTIAAFAVVPLAAAVYWYLHFQLSFFDTLLLPVRVATFTVGPRVGVGDFLMLVRDAGLPALVAYVVAAAVLIAAVVFQKMFLSTEDRLLNFAFYATLSLWVVYHGSYDFVFLLPVAVAALRSQNVFVRNGLLLGTGYFWFVTQFLLDVLSVAPPLEFNLAVLLLIQALIAWEIRLRATSPQPSAKLRAVEA